MDNHAHNESGSCDCGYVCMNCEDKVNWCCDGCDQYYCIRCEEQEDGIHHIDGDKFCTICDDEIKMEDDGEAHRLVYERVMKDFFRGLYWVVNKNI